MKPELKFLRIAALLTIVFHLLGLFAALIWIRNGTATYPLDERMAYVAIPWGGWKIGWTIWMFGAAAFVVFNAAVEKTWKLEGTLPRLAVTIGVVAACLDWVFDMLQIVVLPEFVTAGRGLNVFTALARFASAGGIVVANGLYSISVGLLSIALRGRIPRVAYLFGLGTLVFGLIFSAGGFSSNPRLHEILGAPTFV